MIANQIHTPNGSNHWEIRGQHDTHLGCIFFAKDSIGTGGSMDIAGEDRDWGDRVGFLNCPYEPCAAVVLKIWDCLPMLRDRQDRCLQNDLTALKDEVFG